MKSYKRVVIKIGTSSLTHNTGHPNIFKIESIVKVLADIKNSGIELLVVTSGAIAVGVGKLGLRERPQDIPSKQACAAVGQCELMYMYDRFFSEYNHTVSQVLLSRDDISDETRRENAKNTLTRLLEYNSIPIINENDTIATSEIKIGDNDTLSAVVAKLVLADLLIIMSDIDGVYDSDPRSNPDAKLIREIDNLDFARSVSSGTTNNYATGGMATKIEAASIIKETITDMIILNGDNPKNLYKAIEGREIGTIFKGTVYIN